MATSKAQRRRGGRRGRAEPPGQDAAAPAPPVSRLAVRAIPWLWYLAAAATFWLLQFQVLNNSDIWFHLAAGRAIVEEGALPATDGWSFTAAGRPWQNHEWLSDVVFYLWTRLLGVDGLVLWQWLVVGAAYLLLFHLLWRLIGRPLPAYLVGAFALAVAAMFYDARPNLWTILLFVLTIAWTVVAERPPAWLPVVFVLWMNLHGGAVFGLMATFVTLAAWAAFGEGEAIAADDAGAAARGRRARVRRAALLWLGCCLASLLNPYGLQALTYPLGIAARDRSATRDLLSEWRPPFVPGDLHSPLLPWAIGVFALAAAILLVRGWRGDRRRGAAALGLGVLTLAMAMASRRFVPLFSIAQALTAGVALASLLGERTRREVAGRVARPLLAAAVPLILLLAASWRLADYPLDRRAFDPLSWASRMPVDTVTFMEVNGLSGNVFAYYLWGGYLHWRTAGALQVHFDPRSETVFADATMREHARVVRGDAAAAAIVERSPARFVLWPLNSPEFRGLVERLERSGRWRRLYRDGVSVLLARSSLPLPPLVATPDSAYRSWALGRQALDDQRLAAATDHLERALREQPRLWPACQELAMAHAARGDAARAHATVERCQEIYPDLQLDVVDRILAGRPGGAPAAR